MEFGETRKRRDWLLSLEQGDEVAIVNRHRRMVGNGRIVGVDRRINHLTVQYPDGGRFEFSRSVGLSLEKFSHDKLEQVEKPSYVPVGRSQHAMHPAREQIER